MEKSIQAIRFLGLDMINEANSGHPGIVLGFAPVMYRLFTKHLKFNPNDPHWFDRDRFILSAGHGSALLYATLHLSGYEVSKTDLKQFRQLNSATPGHPEFGDTPGVEATTGPLGQGIGMAVGMALAEHSLRARYNQKDYNVVDHYTYTICGDGDLQEGVALESLSLAGHLGLERLIVLFDSNDVQLDGPTKEAVSDDMEMKMKSMGFDYQLVEDANDLEALDNAIENAKASNKPSFIEIKSVIGAGSPAAGTSKAHGAPIGKEATEAMRKAAGYDYEPFEVPKDVYDDFTQQIAPRSEAKHIYWQETMDEFSERYPTYFEQLVQIIERGLNVDIDKLVADKEIGFNEATRASMGEILEAAQKQIPEMIGGSADLSGSTKVKGLNGHFTQATPLGRNINYGVREHAMAAITNGLTLHQMKAFAGGFFIFSDYMKPSIRLAALMKIPSLFIFTHDSVAVGEDGPTHEPIEQLTMFRAMPNLNVYRPANAQEVKFALKAALESKTTPSVIVLTRQGVTQKHHSDYNTFKQGAYIVSDHKDYEAILMASGSEVELALDTQALLLKAKDIKTRVVAVPSLENFKRQSEKYQDTVLPKTCEKRIAIELGSPDSWYRFATHVYGLERFGKSGKGNDVVADLGFTPEQIMKKYF